MPPRRKIFFLFFILFFYYSQGKNRNEEEKCHIGRHISARVELRQFVWSESRLNWTGQWDPLCTLLSVHAAVGMLRNTIYIPTYLPSMWCTTTLISKRLCVCFFFLFSLYPGRQSSNIYAQNQPGGEGSTSACDLSTQVACRNHPSICIEVERVQDGVADCPDASDEGESK